jgi:hypothetical protein
LFWIEAQKFCCFCVDPLLDGIVSLHSVDHYHHGLFLYIITCLFGAINKHHLKMYPQRNAIYNTVNDVEAFLPYLPDNEL